MVFEAVICAAIAVAGAISCFFAVKNLEANSTKKGLRFVLVMASVALFVVGIAGFNYVTNNHLNDEINEAIEDYNLELVEYEETDDYIYVYCYDKAGYYRDVYLQKDDNGEYVVYVISDNEFVELSSLIIVDEEEEEEE